MRCAGYVALMGEETNAYRLSGRWEGSVGKRTLSRRRNGWEDNKTYLKEI
jgi:hypothetical protein